MSKEKIEERVQTLPELLASDMEVGKKIDLYNEIINREPPEKWLKTNNGIPDVPIERVEWLLTRIFKRWYVEILRSQVIANSIEVTVRVHALHPVTGEWTFNDGIGASPIHTQKGAGATEFDKVNTYSVQMAAPSAKSFAIKDAADHFGNIFGRDVGRKGRMNYKAPDDKPKQKATDPATDEQIAELKKAAENITDKILKSSINVAIKKGMNYSQFKTTLEHIKTL